MIESLLKSVFCHSLNKCIFGYVFNSSIMEGYIKDYKKFKAERDVYVVFSRDASISILDDFKKETSFDFLIDVSESKRGHFFGVDVKGFLDAKPQTIVKEQKIDFLSEIPFPYILVMIDVFNERGYFIWLLKPIENRGLEPINIDNPEIFSFTNEHAQMIKDEVKKWWSSR